MIEHDLQFRNRAGHRQHRFELTVVHRDRFEHQAGLGQQTERFAHARLQQPIGVGLVGDQRADADQFAARLHAFKRTRAGRRIRERHPADHAGDKVDLALHVEEFVGFVDLVEHLHQNGAVDAGFLELRPQNFGREIAIEPRADRGRKLVRPLAERPEVLVTIDDRHIGTLR